MRRFITLVAGAALTLVLTAGPAVAGSSWYVPIRH